MDVCLQILVIKNVCINLSEKLGHITLSHLATATCLAFNFPANVYALQQLRLCHFSAAELRLWWALEPRITRRRQTTESFESYFYHFSGLPTRCPSAESSCDCRLTCANVSPPFHRTVPPAPLCRAPTAPLCLSCCLMPI
jgi:hypothetical protein